MADSSFSRIQRQGHRQRKQLIALAWGLPTVLMLVGSLVALSHARKDREAGLVRRHYLGRLQQAAAREDWPLAALFCRKLSMIEPSEKAHRYQLALTIAAQGEDARAFQLMESIAPRDRKGHDSAHWWMARHLAAASDAGTRESLAAQNWHVTQFLRSHPDDIDARVFLARTEASLGNQAAAIEHLQRVVAKKPELHLVLSRLSGRAGDAAGVVTHAHRAVSIYEARLSERADDIEAMLHLADALALLERPGDAARVLDKGLRLTNHPQVRAGLVRLCLRSIDLLASHPEPAETLEQRLQLIERALVLEPGQAEALKRLAKLVVETDSAASAAGDLLEIYLAEGTAPAVVHMILGAHALELDDTETAAIHFDAAHRLQPDFPACMNNLAWSLANTQPPQLLRASQLADGAIKLAPGRPEYHETRGQILLMLGRHREALPDLERGLQSAGDTSVTHAGLAEVYEVLGQRELAEKHRQKSTRGRLAD